MFAAKEPSSNAYFKSIISTFERQDLSTTNPSASTVLAVLMQQYIDESKGIINTRNHQVHAQNCINKIKENSAKSEADIIKAAFEEIDALTLNLGSFTNLLNAFFSVFPQHLATRPTIVQDKITRQDFWVHALPTWIKSFIEAHRNNKDSNNYEQLSVVSNMVPADMAETFADFLLGQLKDTKRPSKNLGLYRGWVCIALRDLMDKLSAAKKKLVSDTLLKQLDTCGQDISLIGITSALTKATLSPKEAGTVTDSLFNYVTDKLAGLSDLFADHHRDKIRHYMPVIFDTLVAFEKQYNASKKSTIIDLLLLPANFYALRLGVSKLSASKWLSEQQERKLVENIAASQKFNILLPLFWTVIEAANANGDAPTRKPYQVAVNAAKESLNQDKLSEVDLKSATDILVLDKSFTYTECCMTMENLIKVLVDKDTARTSNDLRKNLHQALIDLSNDKDIDAAKLAAMSGVFQRASRPETCDKADMRLSAARAASMFREHLTTDATNALRDELLTFIQEDKSEEAAAVLEVFAKHSKKEDLPEIMTSLMAINNGFSPQLLAQIHADFKQKPWKVKIASDEKVALGVVPTK